MNRKFIICFLILFSLVIVYKCQGSALFNKYLFHNDSSQYTFAFYRFNDAQLFNGDIYADYALRYNTPGVVLIYSFLSRFVDPVLISKTLPFVLCPIAAVYAFLIGDKARKGFTGILMAIMFVMQTWTFSCFSGGHPRAFAFPLLFGAIYYLLIKRDDLFVLILFLQIVIYPPVALITLTAWFFLTSQNMLKSRPSFRGIFKPALILISATCLLMFLYKPVDPFLGPSFTKAEMVKMPEFYMEGRDPHFITSLKMLREDNIAENVTGLPVYTPLTWMLIMGAGAALILSRSRAVHIDRVMQAIGISSLFLYIMAWILFFDLFSPGRYIKYGLLVYLIFMNAWMLDHFILSIGKRYIKLLILICLIILVHVPFLNPDVVLHEKYKLYEFVSSLPKTVLVAGHPDEMDDIPLLTKRKAFVQFETALPYYKNYYEQVSRRTYDFFRMYYSSDRDVIKNVCDRYGINYILVKKDHFKREYLNNDAYYLNPFNDVIKAVVSANRLKGFILENIPSQLYVYEDENYYLVDPQKI
jgi:hypothetical protein